MLWIGVGWLFSVSFRLCKRSDFAEARGNNRCASCTCTYLDETGSTWVCLWEMSC